MGTLYTGQTSCGTYTYTRVKVDYDYSTSKATAKLLHSRTNTWTGSEYADGCVFTFGGVSTGSIYISTGSLGKHTDTQIASVTFSFSNAGGTYSGSTSGYNAPYKFSGSVTIPAQTFTISYNANGGSGQPGNQTKTYGTALTLSSTKPTKSNTTANGYVVTYNGNGGTASKTSDTAVNTTSYTFSKWTTAADGSGTSYNAGASYTANSAATLYAQYSSSTTNGSVTAATATKSNTTSTRTVTFNANGGSCSTASSNSTATVTYSCNGWYTAASGGTKRASSGASFTPSATETLYAQWGSSTGTYSAVSLPSATKSSSTSTRTVTFDANGGTCSTSSLSTSSTTTYTCSGWYTAASGGTKRGAVGGTYTPSATETIYAQYTSSSTDYQAITLPTPTREKYTFKGWSTDKNATTGTTGSYTPSGNVTLYAIWEYNIKGNVYVKINGEWKLASKIAYKTNWGSSEGGSADTSALEDSFITHTLGGNYSNNRITKVGYGTFYGNTSLTGFDAPNVTTIADYAFRDCSNLSSVNMPLLTSATVSAFYNTAIEDINFPELTTMGTYTFGGSSKNKTITLPKLKIVQSNGFRQNTGVTTIDLGACTNIYATGFYNCTALTTLILRNNAVCTLANVSAFSGCSALTSIYVPDSLVDSYKAATNWIDFADKIKGLDTLTHSGGSN